MKYILITLVILASSVITAKSQTLDCQKFRNGTFKLVDSAVGVFYIKRHGDVQIETKEGDPDAFTFKVTWIDDCTYTLIAGEDFRKKYPQIPADAVLTVRILKTGTNSYTQESSASFSDMKITKEITKIGD